MVATLRRQNPGKAASPLRMDEGDAMGANLALVALERVRDGTLPAVAQFRTFGGFGSGGACAMCGHAIPHSKMEIEVEFGSTVRAETLIMHVECYYAWFGALRGVEVSR